MSDAGRNLLVAGAAHVTRTRLEIATKGRLWVFGETLWGWLCWPLGAIVVLTGLDIFIKDWATFWRDFPHAAALGFKAVVFFAVVGGLRGLMRACA